MLAACSQGSKAESPATTSVTSGETTTTTAVAAAPASTLTVRPLQYRDDIVADRLQLQVTHGLDRELSIQTVQLRWSGMSSQPSRLDAVLGVGQRVDYPVPLGEATCDIDGTSIGAPPPTDDATVVFTLSDGSSEVAQVVDTDGTLSALHASACEREMIGEQISLSFDDFGREPIDGRDVTIAVLRLQRQATKGAVQVLSSGNTIPFNLNFGIAEGAPLLFLPADQTVAELPVQFLEARCDAHAVAEAKQPFRFVMQVQLGDEAPRPYVVQPPSEMHAEMLATAAEGCAVLGEDGALSS